MSIALVGSDSAGANNSSHVTTPGFDTSTANLIVIGVTSDVGGGSPTPTDSKSNTWTALTQRTTSGGARVRLFYCLNPTVGAAHTFDLNSANTFPALIVWAFSGVANSSAFDVENGNAFNIATAIQTGSVSPGADDEVIISLLAVDVGATYAIDSGFGTPIQVNFVNGQHYGSAGSHLIQTTAGAVNPTWSSWTSTDCATAIAVFKAAPAAAESIALGAAVGVSFTATVQLASSIALGVGAGSSPASRVADVASITDAVALGTSVVGGLMEHQAISPAVEVGVTPVNQVGAKGAIALGVRLGVSFVDQETFTQTRRGKSAVTVSPGGSGKATVR